MERKGSEQTGELRLWERGSRGNVLQPEALQEQLEGGRVCATFAASLQPKSAAIGSVEPD